MEQFTPQMLKTDIEILLSRIIALEQHKEFQITGNRLTFKHIEEIEKEITNQHNLISQTIITLSERIKELEENYQGQFHDVSLLEKSAKEMRQVYNADLSDIEKRLTNIEEKISLKGVNTLTVLNDQNNCLSKFNERIETLEEFDRCNTEFIEDLIKRIKELEMLNQQCFEANPIKQIEDRFAKIEKTITELVDKIAEIANHYYAEKPEKDMTINCPRCNYTLSINS